MFRKFLVIVAAVSGSSSSASLSSGRGGEDHASVGSRLLGSSMGSSKAPGSSMGSSAAWSKSSSGGSSKSLMTRSPGGSNKSLMTGSSGGWKEESNLSSTSRWNSAVSTRSSPPPSLRGSRRDPSPRPSRSVKESSVEGQVLIKYNFKGSPHVLQVANQPEGSFKLPSLGMFSKTHLSFGNNFVPVMKGSSVVTPSSAIDNEEHLKALQARMKLIFALKKDPSKQEGDNGWLRFSESETEPIVELAKDADLKWTRETGLRKLAGALVGNKSITEAIKSATSSGEVADKKKQLVIDKFNADHYTNYTVADYIAAAATAGLIDFSESSLFKSVPVSKIPDSKLKAIISSSLSSQSNSSSSSGSWAPHLSVNSQTLTKDKPVVFERDPSSSGSGNPSSSKKITTHTSGFKSNQASSISGTGRNNISSSNGYSSGSE